MSVRTMARVWAESRQSGTHLLMLLAIADFADDDGNAYPSVPTLAEKCRMQTRNANVILAALKTSGELQVRPNEGPKGTNRYRIVMAPQGAQSLAGVQEHAGVQSLASPPAKACSKPLQRIADEPSLNHQYKEKRLRKAKPTPVWVSQDQMVADGLQAETASEFIAHRQGLKRPLTVRAWSDLLSEAAKAQWPVEDAVAKLLAKGWISFEARFVEGAARSDGAASARPWEGAR